MENMKTWLLIADASTARLFCLPKSPLYMKANDNLALLDEFNHPDSRKKDQDLVTDRMGFYGFGNYEEPTSPKVHEAETFAIQLASHLNESRIANNFHDLIIVAPPSFMGLLKKHIPHEVQKLLSHTIEKDYTHQTPHELVQHLMNLF